MSTKVFSGLSIASAVGLGLYTVSGNCKIYASIVALSLILIFSSVANQQLPNCAAQKESDKVQSAQTSYSVTLFALAILFSVVLSVHASATPSVDVCKAGLKTFQSSKAALLLIIVITQSIALAHA